MKITDETIKIDGFAFKRLHVLYTDSEDEKLLCDSCNKERQLIHIEPLCGDLFCICKDCLQLIIDEF